MHAIALNLQGVEMVSIGVGEVHHVPAITGGEAGIVEEATATRLGNADQGNGMMLGCFRIITFGQPWMRIFG